MTIRRGRRPGDERVRVARARPIHFQVGAAKRSRQPPSPWVILILGFAFLILVGTTLLLLPMSTSPGRSTTLLTALFTATSAVCVTGLVVVDTATHWTPAGQTVILGLIQLGGFGFMTGSTVVLLLLIGRRTHLRDRLLVQASTGAELGSVGRLVRRVAVFTVLAEVVGALVLFVAFLGRGLEAGQAAWWGLFHSVSAFNNAGFDLTGDFRSLTPFVRDPLILGVIAALLVIGGLGFAIVADITTKRDWTRLALESKVVILTSLSLIVGGAAMIGALEWSNPATLGPLPEGDRIVNAIFQSVTARTAGFNALAMGGLVELSLLVTMALMFIGGASGSTAGGIKVNTFALLLIAIVSTARGDPSATAFGRRVPHVVVYRAVAVALLSIAVAFALFFGLSLFGTGTLLQRAFETISALGTVGLTTGITPRLPDPALALLAIGMFIGRLGPLTLVMALTASTRPVSHRPAVETMRIG